MASTRIIGMQCGNDESYALLFFDADGEEYVQLRIYDAATRELVQEMETPFPSGSVSDIQFCQSFDVMFFAQGDTYPCKLKRETDTSASSGYTFSFEQIDFKVEPIMDWDTNSEHAIQVFALPVADVIDENGSIPQGTVVADTASETFTFAYSKYKITTTGSASSFVSLIKRYRRIFSFYCTAKVDNPKLFSTGRTIALDGTFQIRVSLTAAGDVIVTPMGVQPYTLGLSSTYTIVLAATAIQVDDVSADGTVTFLVGKISILSFVSYSMSVLGYSSETEATITSGSGNPLYIATTDAPSSESVENTAFYQKLCGTNYQVGITVDGGNFSDSLVVGQLLALKAKNKLYQSDTLDYDTYPEGVMFNTNPAVETLEPLESKKDKNGNELRPDTGGGYGYASDFFPVRGEVTLKTEGTWSGVVEMQEYDKLGHLSTIAKISSENGLSNTELTRNVTEFGSSVRVACTRREKAYQTAASINGDQELSYIVQCVDEGCQWTIESTDQQTVFFRIDEKRTLSDGTNAYIATCLGGLTTELSTYTYALGAWSTENGYPRFVSIFQERICYAGNKQKPTTLWLSKTNDWTDFEDGSLDTSPMNFTMQTDKYDTIKWIAPTKSYISIGTDYGEWLFGEANGGVATPTTGRFVNTSNIGNTDITAQNLGTALIMVKTGNRELHRIDYNTLSEESAGTQVTMLAKHLFEEDKVADMFVVRSPANMLYCVMESGRLVSFTYEPEYNVAGWARHEILDGVVCATTIRRSGSDVLVMVVKNGDDYLLGEIDPQSSVFTDAGNEYESFLLPTPLSVSSTNGAYGARSVFAGCDIYVTKGTRFYVKLPQGNWTRVDAGFGTDGSLNDFPEKKITIPVSAGWADEATIQIKTSYPAPLVVSAIGAKISATR